MKKTTFILFVLINFKCFGGFIVTPNCKLAYKQIYNLEFEKGRRLLDIEKNSDPKNGIPVLFDNSIDFLIIALGEDKKLFEQYKKNSDNRLDKLEKNDQNSPYYLYSKAEVYFQSSFLRLKFKEFVTSAYDLRKAYKLLEENRKKYPRFELNDKLLGVFHTFIGAVPEEYSWLINFAGFEGTIDQGLKELNRFAYLTEKNPDYYYLRDEAIIFLITTQLNVDFEKEKLSKTLKIHDSFESENILLEYTKGIALSRLGRNDEAIEIFSNIKFTTTQFQLNSINYALGMAKLRRLDSDANIYLEKFVRDFEGTTNIKSAYLKLAWYYQINGNEQKYMKNLNNCIIKGGDAYFDEDLYAFRYAKSGQKSDNILLKSRLLFDGGYYTKSLEVITLNKNSIEKSEYNTMDLLYRTARCHQHLKNPNEAIKYYKETIKEATGKPYFYACKSALELGKIFEEYKKCDLAADYYKKSLKIPSDEYKTSFTQQAKAGLKNLSKSCKTD